jgi:hypothetical protein
MCSVFSSCAALLVVIYPLKEVARFPACEAERWLSADVKALQHWISWHSIRKPYIARQCLVLTCDTPLAARVERSSMIGACSRACAVEAES